MIKDINPSITVFTPCYNVANTIQEVAKCVNDQSFKSFEWIIYNDGSNDDSDTVIRKIIGEYPHLNIVYMNPGVNRGKHIAWNRALDIARGELFICADADDPFEKDSFQFFYDRWCEVRDDESCCGILGLVDSLETGEMHAGKWPNDGWKTNFLDFSLRHGIDGETWGVTRTDILKKRKFPEIYNGYFGEHYIWHALAVMGYNYRCYNKITRHYRTTSVAGITASKNRRRKRPQQSQIGLITALWDLKYTSSWYLKYSKIEWIKMVLKIPYYIYCYLFLSDRENFE